MKSVKEFINRQRWTFAKTYADRAPHEYIIRGKINGTDEEFTEFARVIRDNSFPAKFWNSQYHYFYCDGRLYWLMEKDIEKLLIINRCDLNNYELNVRKKDNAVNL